MKLIYTIIINGLIVLNFSCSTKKSSAASDWCDQSLRSQFSNLKEIKTTSNWFKVYLVGEGVYAIAEPFNFQEVISYLILGKEKALLFDSGMGLSSIKAITQELTKLPVVLINSHTHYDHIGGNHEFDFIFAMNTPFSIERSKKGLPHDLVKHEVSQDALCKDKLSNIDTTAYYIKPFHINKFIDNGFNIDLGNRKIEVISVPGHTPDAIALLDHEYGYLWSGDTFYEAPIWLFDEGTDLAKYEESINKLAFLSPKLNTIFPAHNTPIAKPLQLKAAAKGFKQIMEGIKKPKNNPLEKGENKTIAIFEFDGFSFMIRKELLLSN